MLMATADIPTLQYRRRKRRLRGLEGEWQLFAVSEA